MAAHLSTSRIGFINILISFVLFLPGCSGNNSVVPPASAIPPAGPYCMALGYAAVHGANSGSCVFPDQSACPEWDFYRGKCGRKFSYCEKNGFALEARSDHMGSWTAEYGVCIFADASECLEQDYFDGKCAPSQCGKWFLSQGGCISK